MEDELYPWEECRERPYPEEEDFDFEIPEEHIPCCQCLFFESALCNWCTEA